MTSQTDPYLGVSTDARHQLPASEHEPLLEVLIMRESHAEVETILPSHANLILADVLGDRFVEEEVQEVGK
jgi:hypothetical protein